MVAGQMTFDKLLSPSVPEPSVREPIVSGPGVPVQDERRLARRHDPATSVEAARKVCRSGNLGEQKKAVLKALRQNNGSTSAEISKQIGEDRYLASRRLPDLERDDLVERGRARKCTVVGSLCLTWWVTELGRKDEEKAGKLNG